MFGRDESPNKGLISLFSMSKWPSGTKTTLNIKMFWSNNVETGAPQPTGLRYFTGRAFPDFPEVWKCGSREVPGSMLGIPDSISGAELEEPRRSFAFSDISKKFPQTSPPHLMLQECFLGVNPAGSVQFCCHIHGAQGDHKWEFGVFSPQRMLGEPRCSSWRF